MLPAALQAPIKPWLSPTGTARANQCSSTGSRVNLCSHPPPLNTTKHQRRSPETCGHAFPFQSPANWPQDSKGAIHLRDGLVAWQSHSHQKQLAFEADSFIMKCTSDAREARAGAVSGLSSNQCLVAAPMHAGTRECSPGWLSPSLRSMAQICKSPTKGRRSGKNRSALGVLVQETLWRWVWPGLPLCTRATTVHHSALGHNQP